MSPTTPSDSLVASPLPPSGAQGGATVAAPLGPLGLAARMAASTGLGKAGWWTAGGVVLGSVALGELGHLGSTGLTLLTAGAGWWWFTRRRGPSRSVLPSDALGWHSRCTELLAQFERLDPEGQQAQERRREQLQAWHQEGDRQALTLAVVGDPALLAAPPEALATLLRAPRPLRLHLGHRLPRASGSWQWSPAFEACDALLFVAPAPLSAADLRWLTALPPAQPAWVLLRLAPGDDPALASAELASQLGAAAVPTLLPWDGDAASLGASLAPLASGLGRSPQQLIEASRLRRIQALHRQWQADLEQHRRLRFQVLQRRTQWLVAGAVVASPLPGLDLAAVVVGNGLMLQEMAALWDCGWSIGDLEASAAELARAAIALGVAEWSSQALLGLMRLDGATWLIGSALQALSAAYLTRVVARAMADVMALSVGVEAPDLARIKREAPLLVARAAASEKLDWQGFLDQAKQWLQQSALLSGAAPGSAAPQGSS